MNLQHVNWKKILFWGGITAILYWALFHYSHQVANFAYHTPVTCVVGQGADSIMYHKLSPDACASKGGVYTQGHWYYVFVPIIFALAISYSHGIFTGLFWDIMGLKPAAARKK